MFPFYLVFRYLRYPWSHIIYCAIASRGERVLAFFSSSVVQNLRSASGWHGNWTIHSHVIPGLGQQRAIVVMNVHWAGLVERSKVLLFYLSEGELLFIGNMFRSIDTVEWWWPDHAEVYNILWYEVSERRRLDIIIIDRSFPPANDIVQRQVLEF